MKEISKIIINDFQISKLGYDFMGYDVNSERSLDFHHLLIPRKNFPLEDKSGVVHKDGYEYWNGVILVRDTSHDYLHIIERYDFNIFTDITSEMLDQKIKGRLDPRNIKLIDMRLKDFEQEWEGEIGYNNEILIKKEYMKRLSRVR